MHRQLHQNFKETSLCILIPKEIGIKGQQQRILVICSLVVAQIMIVYQFLHLRNLHIQRNHWKIALFHRSSNSTKSPFLVNLKQLIDEKRPDILVGDFNIDDLCNNSCTQLNEVLVDDNLVVSEPPHLDGALLAYIYV